MNTNQLRVIEINKQLDEARALRTSLQPHQVILDNILHKHMSKLYEELDTINH